MEAPRDWGGLGGIVAEALAIDEELRQRDMVDCPVCGEPLQENGRGAVNCVYGHFYAPQRPKAADYA